MRERVGKSILEIFERFGKGPEFGEDVYLRLKEPIPLCKGGKTLFAQVDEMKVVPTPFGEELQLRFRVDAVPPPVQVDRAHRTIVSVPTDGRPHHEPPTLFYTLTSQNSLEQNEQNLSDFVFSQWEKAAAAR